MLRATHAALHVFDLDTGSCHLSDRELNLEERAVRSYVQRMMRKASGSAENSRASLSQGAALAGELKRYAAGQRDLVDLSQDIARTLWEQLRASEDATPCDLLVADFTDTEKAPSAAASSEVPFDEDGPGDAGADIEDRTRRFLGVVLLPRRKAFMHELVEVEGLLSSGLFFNDAALPNPTQKLGHYALVDLDSLEVELVDEGVQIGGRPVLVLTDVLLGCEAQPSTREVVDTVVRIVGDVAQEHGRSAAVAMADAKDYVTHSAQQTTAVSPAEVGEHVFADEPDLARRFEEAVRAESLPEEVAVKPSVANRIAKNHRIRTDTGIDITFPSAYAADQNYIEFSRDNQGGIQITIHAASIENR